MGDDAGSTHIYIHTRVDEMTVSCIIYFFLSCYKVPGENLQENLATLTSSNTFFSMTAITDQWRKKQEKKKEKALQKYYEQILIFLLVLLPNTSKLYFMADFFWFAIFYRFSDTLTMKD
jgi:hypothetical protein